MQFYKENAVFLCDANVVGGSVLRGRRSARDLIQAIWKKTLHFKKLSFPFDLRTTCVHLYANSNGESVRETAKKKRDHPGRYDRR